MKNRIELRKNRIELRIELEYFFFKILYDITKVT